MGFEDDGKIDATGHRERRGVDHRRRNAPGLIAAQPGGVLDTHGAADAGIDAFHRLRLANLIGKTISSKI
jgi:hypothetical protein